MSNHLTRRTFLAVTGGAAASIALSTNAGANGGDVENEEARAYYRVLLKHTRWVETLWDDTAGHYPFEAFYFVNVLGNAVLLTHGTYDAELAGVDRAMLHEHTVRTIDHFAASNFWATDAQWGDGGYEWGGRIYWDTTMESYFVAAAKLLWADLSTQTRADIDAIAIGAADYVVGLGATEDPRSGGWSSNGLAGGYGGDSKIEEMGAKSMPIATGLAHAPGHPSASNWREWLTRWMSNMTGLPATDEHNDTLLDGKPVSWWNQAQNIFETYVVENHASYAPIYQESVGAYPGRNAIHFLISGEPLPDVFHYQPNADGLWRAMRQLGTSAGLTAHPMVNDRHHLYGRDVLPLVWRRIGQQDRLVARSERLLLAHLEPYLDYPPVNHLTKFSGEPKYEPEARAEVAMAYLLHVWRDRLHGDVDPVTEKKYWTDARGVTDYGSYVGLVGHQTPESLAMVVTKPGYVKFVFLPGHDDWLFDASGAAPMFLPSTQVAVQAKNTALYHHDQDGFDGTATVLQVSGGFAGFATLPTGAVVYATSGTAANEGMLRLFSLDMPGVEGLDGDRTFHGEGGPITLEPDGGTGGDEELAFPTTPARYIRMLGGRPATQYGYSLWSFEAYSPGSATDVARGKPPTASSNDPSFLPLHATDGDPGTRWAVARAERPRPDSWLAVDLGTTHDIDRVRLSWESAYGAEYRIQVSMDGVAWEDVVSVPTGHTFQTGWVNIDDRAGFVVRGSDNSIRVTATSVALSAGPADRSAGVVVEGYPADADATVRAWRAPAPSTTADGLAASVAADCLSLFNLTDRDIAGAVQIDLEAGAAAVFAGSQDLEAGTCTVNVQLGTVRAEIRPAMFELASVRSADGLSLTATAHDPLTLDLRNNADGGVSVDVWCVQTRTTKRITIAPGRTVTLRFE